MKAKKLFEAINVLAAFAAIAQEAHELLSPHMRDLSAFVPKPVRELPARIGNAANAFVGPIEQRTRVTRHNLNPRPERRPQSARVTA